MDLPLGAKLLRKLAGNRDIRSLSFSKSGRRLASAGIDGVKVWRIKYGTHTDIVDSNLGEIISVAFGPIEDVLATAGNSQVLKLWNLDTAETRANIEIHSPVERVIFDPAGRRLATANADTTIGIFDIATTKLTHSLSGHTNKIRSIEFDWSGRSLLSASNDSTLGVWDAQLGRLERVLSGHHGQVLDATFHPSDGTIASAGADQTVKVWNAVTGKLLRTLEGHTAAVEAVAFAAEGRLLLSKGADGTLRIWSCKTWHTVGILPTGPRNTQSAIPPFAYHEGQHLVAISAFKDESGMDDVTLFKLDVKALLGESRPQSAIHYVNAKVVLVGDTSVGKSGLSLVLTHKPFLLTDSSLGRHVYLLDSHEIEIEGVGKQIREVLLWDLAGQPGYRVIHQLHLKEVAVALVVFDARSETDPLAGVRHWERALRLAHQRGGEQAVPMKKFLVAARADRGGVSVSKYRIQSLSNEFGFDAYFETSAKEGWQIAALREAIEAAIQWNSLPIVTSEELFVRIKGHLLEAKRKGRILATSDQLYDEFEATTDLRPQFDTCIGRLENHDLIRRLSFGDYVLMEPEILDSYASALVNAAKSEPEGLGSIAEEVALTGQFHIPEDHRIADRGQEQLLLHATVEELVLHDLALRESAADGRYLVFPSQFNRDYEDAPEPKGRALTMKFDGPVQSIYSTLAVRLGHSGLFETARTEMWRNAVIFAARAGGRCGIYTREFDEARGQLTLFFSPDASIETRFHFEEYIHAHLSRRAITGSVEVARFFICGQCGTPVPQDYVRIRREKGFRDFACACGQTVSLVEPKDKLAEEYPSRVEAMNQSADRRRDFDAFLVSASGETRTKSFVEWAGGERVTLAIVFTDVVGSTALENKIGGERMGDLRRAHFAQGNRLIAKYSGRLIKNIGDSLMVAFHSAEQALDFSLALSTNPGVEISIRAGIHLGPMQVEGDDVFGGTVNFAARVVGAIKDAEVWLSSRAKDDIDALRARRHQSLQWARHDDVTMKGFPGKFNLWSVVYQALSPR